MSACEGRVSCFQDKVCKRAKVQALQTADKTVVVEWGEGNLTLVVKLALLSL